MALPKSSNGSVLLERVLELVHTNLKSEAAPVAELTAAIYSQVALDELQLRSDSDLYGAILSLWRLANDYQGNGAEINILNPSLDKNGWHSNHTIIEIAVRDMPFLVDSVRMALSRLGISAHLLLHAPLQIQRNKRGAIEHIGVQACDADKVRETLFHIEVDRQATAEARQLLANELTAAIHEVEACVSDWNPMLKQLAQVIQEVEKSEYPDAQVSKEEVLTFLHWVERHNFTMLGYQQTQITPVAGDHEISVMKGSELGILKLNVTNTVWKLSDLLPSGQQVALSPELLVLTKSNQKSKVHRPAFTDYIGIKRFDKKGNVIGEHRFIGLYSSTLYNNSALHVPMLSHKLERIMKLSGLVRGSHAYKALLNIMETYPRDELLQANEQELLDVGVGVLQMQERDMSRLFVRRELFGRFYSCMVFVNKERYNTQLRKLTQTILKESFSSESPVEFTTYFDESNLARTHYIVHVSHDDREIDFKQLEQNLIEAARSWDDRFAEALTKKFGENQGRQLAARYEGAFAPSYKERVLPNSALVDIDKIEQLQSDTELGMLFYQPQERVGSEEVCLKLFHRNLPIPLSDVLPLLENLGLKVIGERPYEVKDSGGQIYWILEFNMLYPKAEEVDFALAQERFQQALAGIWQGTYEDDGFNRLVLGAELTARQVSLLRGYARYMRQLGVSFSQQYIQEALNHYPQIARDLVVLFEQRFDPELQSDNSGLKQEALLEQIESALEQVSNLDDDRIIRRFQAMILATVRTNAYQPSADGQPKPYISFKLLPEEIPEVPLPVPAFEIFVYSPRLEGVHLRGGKVARGGLRWSDRREDFRTEILGLVKAQQVKNTVIVPVGAKGGFVCKQMPEAPDRDTFLTEGQACYRLFIRGLLDVTDNLSNGEPVPPAQVVRYDEDDAYLVVAADKGTATFSDIANEIAQEYGFWLGDAFASGGSQGYDHKKMGITAKGAWESVKRHFREIGTDCQTTEFTAIAIGDMAGDVFGNGMLLSEKTRLVAAFNHLHIFIDPNPDAKTSYAERQRLFELPRSSWTDYQSELISKGGAIYERSAKSVKLSSQAQKALGLTQANYTPNELIQAILQAPVDLIWNGGIGTYVKSERESHIDVGDRANDAVRVNGSQLKAKIFGEGGNLGATQLGRIEYARTGGRINTDFIDNVGGVDCSDAEVNIKILLSLIEQDGEMTRKQRNQLLVSMTDDVSELVLDDCYQQTQSISVTQKRAGELLKDQIRFIQALERKGILNRELEFLPTDEEISQRQIQGQGLTRPELSVLISYDKMTLKEALNSEEITADSFHSQAMLSAFPPTLQKKHAKKMLKHPLQREIIATQAANQVVNDMGLNFVNRMHDQTGASIQDIVSCYTMAREVFMSTQMREQIQALDNHVAADVQLDCLDQLRRVVRHGTRWFLRHRNRSMSIKDTVMFYQPALKAVLKQLPQSLATEDLEQIQTSADSYTKQGVPKELALALAQQTLLFSALDITQVAETQQRPIELISDIYFMMGSRLELHWFLDQIEQQPVANHWQALARSSFREELDWQQRSLTEAVNRYCQDGCSAKDMVELWFVEHQISVERWMQMLNEFKTASGHEYAKFSVALRELMLLSHTSDQLQ